MATAVREGLPRPPALARPWSPMAGVLSYLVPGLGQIAQGRVGKGVLFLVCIYALFFYGVARGAGSVTLDGREYRLGLGQNVYLPDTAEEGPRAGERQLPALAQNLYNRPQFAGQFWVGVAAWPAVLQYLRFDRRLERDIVELQAEIQSRENADPEEAQRKRKELKELEARTRLPLLGTFMREPDPVARNAVENANDKRLDLAWVYTVIAGVLNILVIYDAVAGPAFGPAGPDNPKKE